MLVVLMVMLLLCALTCVHAPPSTSSIAPHHSNNLPLALASACSEAVYRLRLHCSVVQCLHAPDHSCNVRALSAV